MKKFLKKGRKLFLTFLEQYPVSRIFLIVCTILGLLSIEINHSLDYYEIIFKLFLSSCMFLACSIVIESLFHYKDYKIYLFLLAVFLSILFFVFYQDTFFYYRIYYGVLILLGLVWLEQLYFKSGLSLFEYFVKVLENLIKFIVFVVLIELVLYLIYVLIQRFIPSFHHPELIYDSQIVLGFLFFIPCIVISFTMLRKTISKFLLFLFRFVFIPFGIILMILLYIYMIILLFRGYPSNQVFFVLFISFCYFFFLISIGTYLDDLHKYIILIPILFIPLIGVQCHVLGIRIFYHGLSVFRYLGIILILFEIFTLFFYLYKNNLFYDFIFRIAMILVFISFFIPAINMETATYASQGYRLKSLLKKDYSTLSSAKKKEVQTIYQFLNQNKKSRRYLPKKKLSDQNTVFEDTSIDDNGFTNMEDYETYLYSADADRIDVSSYQTLSVIGEDDIFDDSIWKEIITEEILHQNYGYLKENPYIEVDDSVIYPTYLNIEYKISEDEEITILDFTVQGYYLSR